MITYNKLRKNLTDGMRDIRVRTYTVMGFTIFTVFVLTTFAIRPVLFSLSNEIGQLSALQSEDKKLQTDVTNLGSAEITYNNEVQGKTDILDVALPNTPATGVLFANLQAIAQGDKVQITSTRFAQTAVDQQALHIPPALTPALPNVTPLYFSISGTGTPQQLTTFMSDLQAFPRTFNIIETSISGDADKNGNLIDNTFSLLGYVFYAGTQ